jgi:hypothetical protein
VVSPSSRLVISSDELIRPRGEVRWISLAAGLGSGRGGLERAGGVEGLYAVMGDRPAKVIDPGDSENVPELALRLLLLLFLEAVESGLDEGCGSGTGGNARFRTSRVSCEGCDGLAAR